MWISLLTLLKIYDREHSCLIVACESPCHSCRLLTGTHACSSSYLCLYSSWASEVTGLHFYLLLGLVIYLNLSLIRHMYATLVRLELKRVGLLDFLNSSIAFLVLGLNSNRVGPCGYLYSFWFESQFKFSILVG